MISNLISLKTWLYSSAPFSGPWVQQPMRRTTLGWVFNIFITSSSCKQWWWSWRWRWRWRRWQCSKGIFVRRFPKYWRQCRPSHLKKIFPLFFTCWLLQSLHCHSTCALQKRFNDVRQVWKWFSELFDDALRVTISDLLFCLPSLHLYWEPRTSRPVVRQFQ